MKVKRWALVVLNRIALTIFLYASFLYFLKRIVFVKRHVWFFRIYFLTRTELTDSFFLVTLARTSKPYPPNIPNQ